ncbi:Hsp70 family protein [Rugosimonospora africana]|uniref:Hsp70 protein n=1 Tax=Rugosimonospora africana TaxID=556532 RepID=A0A8J3QMH5_9ACTN|nr:Hsp70 family protein [Rugosimonospora africana]GIH13770.1 hypothetical protein Raf01_19420 [Rugosimonospora africana]
MDAQGWRLSVDFGTSHTVAVYRRPDGIASPLLFGTSPLLTSGVFAGPAGLLTGPDAERAAAENPAGYEPHPKRRIDDGTVQLGDRKFAAVDLIATVLVHVAIEAYRVAGAAPAHVVLTHPAAWSPARLATLTEAARRAGLTAVSLVPEPVAAAAYFSMVVRGPLPPGRCALIYDLGAGTFDVSVVRQTPQGFQVVASDGVPDLGQLDPDEPAAGPLLDRTVDVTLATLQSAGVPREGIDGLFLIGGSSGSPAVTTLLQQRLGIAPTVVDRPELVVAQGGLCLAPPAPAPTGAASAAAAPTTTGLPTTTGVPTRAGAPTTAGLAAAGLSATIPAAGGPLPPAGPPMPAGAAPPWPAPPGSVPPGAATVGDPPPGSAPPGSTPPGSTPPGSVPPGSVPPWGAPPPGSVPPGGAPPIPGQWGPVPGTGQPGPWATHGPVTKPPRRPNPVVRRVVIALCCGLVVLLVAGVGAVLWYTGSLPFGSKLNAQGRHNATLFAGHDDLLKLAKPFLNDVECQGVIPVDDEVRHVRCQVPGDTVLKWTIDFEAVTSATARDAQRETAAAKLAEKLDLRTFGYTTKDYASGRGAAWRVDGEVVPTCYLYWDDNGSNSYATLSRDEFVHDVGNQKTDCEITWNDHLSKYLGETPHISP